jgi:hypothetical protein
MIHYFFDAAAYDVYLPMAAGLITSLFMTAQPLIAAAEKQGGAEQEPEEQILAPVGPASSAPDPRVAPARQERNPYRFGRRRPGRRN